MDLSHPRWCSTHPENSLRPLPRGDEFQKVSFKDFNTAMTELFEANDKALPKQLAARAFALNKKDHKMVQQGMAKMVQPEM